MLGQLELILVHTAVTTTRCLTPHDTTLQGNVGAYWDRRSVAIVKMMSGLPL